MVWLLSVCDLLLVIILVLVGAAHPARARLTSFELGRRAEKGDREAKEALRKERLAPVVRTAQRSVTSLVLVGITVLLIVTFGWWLGLFVALLVALEYGAIGRIPFVERRAQTLYMKYEVKILKFAEKYERGAFRLILTPMGGEVGELHIESRDDLLHALDQATFFTKEEKTLLSHAVMFRDIQVSEIMTPRSMIEGVEKKELLGPLVLSDLHATGHSRFPVIDGDLDHIVGVLYLQNLLIVGDEQHSQTAAKAMDTHVYFIRDNEMLWHALGAFLKTHHHLFVVVNEFRETVGLLSLEDVIESLIGQKIVGEFDVHDDLRMVAEKHKETKNTPTNGKDV